jgi:hypothetical protein
VYLSLGAITLVHSSFLAFSASDAGRELGSQKLNFDALLFFVNHYRDDGRRQHGIEVVSSVVADDA